MTKEMKLYQIEITDMEDLISPEEVLKDEIKRCDHVICTYAAEIAYTVGLIRNPEAASQKDGLYENMLRACDRIRETINARREADKDLMND